MARLENNERADRQPQTDLVRHVKPRDQAKMLQGQLKKGIVLHAAVVLVAEVVTAIVASLLGQHRCI